jgi:hypothetical protein
MSGKTFEEYLAEYTREPFSIPMPDGTAVSVPQHTINTVLAIRAAAAGDPGNKFAGLEVAVGAEDAAKIIEAWGKMPPSAWDALLADMRKAFGTKN